jgi:hypothetical protein
MLAIVPRMPTAAATGFTTFRAPVFAIGADYCAGFAREAERAAP